MASDTGCFTIEYYALGALRATDIHAGPLRKAEYQALAGMIRHLYSGVDRARILDTEGREVNALHAPVPAAAPDLH
jgi:hypothetical protein